MDSNGRRETITQVRRQRTEARSEVRALKKQIQDMEKAHMEEMSALKKEFAERKQSFQEAQAAVTTLLLNGAVPPKIDADIRDDFYRLKALWKPFAKMYAISSILDLDQNAFDAACNISEVPWPAITGRGTQLLRSHPSAPSILLNTNIAHVICFRIVQDPFFGLKNDSHGITSPADSESLHWISEFAKDSK